MGKNKFNKKEVVSSYLIDGDGLVTIDFEYPYKVMVFVYNDGSVEKKIVNRYCFTEDDKFFFEKEYKALWDYMTVSSVLQESIKRCGLKKYSYEFDGEIMENAKLLVRDLKLHNIRFVYFKGEEYDFRIEYEMKESQFLHYAKFLNAENDN